MSPVRQPRASNTSKWSIAQRALTSGNDAATAAGELLQRAARYGLEVLATLGLTGTIYSDCQGLIRKLLHCMYSGVTPRVPVTLSSATASPRYNTTSSNSVGRVVTRNEPTSLPTAGTNTNGVSSQRTTLIGRRLPRPQLSMPLPR